MIDQDQIISDVTYAFDNVDVSTLSTIDDVIAVAVQYQDIIEQHGLITTHHIIEAIDDPDNEETITIVSPLVDSDDVGADTEIAFMFRYTKTEDMYEVFGDIDYSAVIEDELDVAADDFETDEDDEN